MTDEVKRASSQIDSNSDKPDPRLLEAAFHSHGADTEPCRPSRATTSSSAWIGRTLGKYQITGTLGEGGMGVVLRAHDPMIERDVAIKLLPEELAEDEKALRRFLAEAKAAGKLNHPNVVSIYEIGQEGQSYFLVMELIPGGSISDGLDQQHAYSVLDATRIVIDACNGLTAAHGVGLIHRDVKPANLMKTADGSIKITDFGLAKSTSPRAREMTHAGLVVGTPYFMSPEQCDGKTVDARSDIYSLLKGDVFNFHIRSRNRTTMILKKGVARRDVRGDIGLVPVPANILPMQPHPQYARKRGSVTQISHVRGGGTEIGA